MKRSGGVTASAVIAIIGSVLSILAGGLAIVAAVMMRFTPNLPTPEGQPALPIAPAAMLLVESILFIGLGALGIASAVGLLRLKNWARICFIVFGGLLCFVSVMGAIGFFVAMLVMPQTIPPEQNVSPGLIKGVLAVVLIFELMLAALGVWWLVFFNRRNVKAQFLEKAEAATPRRGPLSITIIAWLLVVGGLSLPFQLLFSYPTIMFGFVLRGWPCEFFGFCSHWSAFWRVSECYGGAPKLTRWQSDSMALVC